ncbi:hypothetical protein KBD69_02170 [Candidatus Woesebacteria bacterium]|nr:hypothetical protein [Candidatus Woesebacteria bacterium]
MRYIVPILATLTFLLSTILVRSESLTVSLVVGVTEVVFSGYTSPSSQIVIKEDGSVVGTTTSDSSGLWTKTVSVAVPTTHTYELYATDASSIASATISYSLSVAGGTTTSISNIVMPPTVILSGTTLSGQSYPGSSLTATSDLGDTLTLTVPGSGMWSTDLTTWLTGGPHNISVVTTVGSFISLSSTSLTYTTPAPSPSPTTTPNSSSSLSPTPTSSPSPSPSSAPTSTPIPYAIEIYDQNQDGRLGLGELISVITSWLKQHLPCDLNRDTRCDLIDLSILLYYFER